MMYLRGNDLGISRDNGRLLPHFGMDYAIFGHERAMAALFGPVFLFFAGQIASPTAKHAE
ncbi:exoDNAse [Paenibacillus popilliae ATCC 14706]|uniref:ExoDNAse n=1 Tax=Paenibacillus popilliae ATCC 14706 TaxID=1212764 RepID=M9M7Y2_PAEPP|nr:exoDNAse [Paenibacillus popilliae ATCC 14706]